MDKKKTQEYLNAIYQNTRTAMQSIADIITKVEDKALNSELERESEIYARLAKECEEFAKSAGGVDAEDNNFFEKAKLWSAVNMGTLTDKSTRNIAEMMLIGTFMGIITCIKDSDDHHGVSERLDEISEKLHDFERENIDRLIPFLREGK